MKNLFLPIFFLISCGSPQKEYKIEIHEQESGTMASLRGLDVVNEQIAWASGSGGTILKTVDGGITWQDVSIQVADTVDFRDIEAFSATEAVVLSAGFPGISYHTEDGGRSWQLGYLDERPGIFFDAMDFWDAQAGIAFGDALEGKVVLIKTNDGGKSWQRISPDQSPDALAGEGGFAASGTCITTFGDSSVWIAMGTPKSRVLFSPDRGKSWRPTTTPMAQEVPGAGIFSIAFSSADYGLVVGGNYMAPNDTSKTVAVSQDGGKSWSLIKDSGINGFKSAITHVPNSEIWIASGPTGVSVSKDNGQTWVLNDSTAYHTMVMANEKYGWLTGAKGKISRLAIHSQQVSH